MKQKLLTLLTLLLGVLGGVTSAWADAVETISVNSSKNWEGASQFSVAVANGSMQAGYCKWQKNNAMTITNTNGKTITGITITYTEQGYSPSNSGKTYSDQMSVTTGTLNAKATTTTTTWSGSTSATSFVISWSNSGWDLRVASVAITYDDGKAASTFALTSASEVEVAIAATSTITSENNVGTVTYTSNDETVATVTSSGVITAVAGGKTTITVTDPGSVSVSGATKTVTVLVPYPNPSAAESYVLNQDTYAFSNTANTKYYFTNGFTITLSSGASFDNGGLAKSKKYSHARAYTIHTPSNVTVTFAVITARNNYKNENSNPAANWGNVFGTDYSSEGDLPWSNEDPAEKDFVVLSPSAGADLPFQPGGNQWQAIIELYTVTYGAKYTVSYAAGDGSGSMADETRRANASFTLPASTFIPPVEKGFEGWLCSVDAQVYAAGAEYTMTSANTTFTAQYGSVEGKTLIRVTLGGGTNATVTGAIGGAADVQVQSDKKFGNGHYAGFTLAGGNTFHTGDIINVNIATAANGNGTIAIYDTDKSTILYNTEVKGSVGDNKFALPAACNGKTTLYICRTNDNGWNAYVNYIEVSRPVAVSTLSGRNYASYVTSQKLDFASAEGITAYIATGLNGGNNAVVLQSVDVVPAGTPIIVKTTTQGATVNVPVTTAEASDVSANKLVAGDGTTVANSDYYYLASDQFHLATSGTLQSGKAYLQIPATARDLSIVIDDATALTLVNSEKGIVIREVYNLAGQRVAAPTKGLYITNGKKVIIK